MSNYEIYFWLLHSEYAYLFWHSSRGYTRASPASMAHLVDFADADGRDGHQPFDFLCQNYIVPNLSTTLVKLILQHSE
jgi:hypothetical protein